MKIDSRHIPRFDDAILKDEQQKMKEEMAREYDLHIGSTDKLFECHSSVMKQHSKVIKAMLESGCKESIEGKIIFKNVSTEVIRSVVELIYEDETYIDSEDVLDLLELAHMYEIEFIKTACEENIFVHLFNERTAESLGEVAQIFNMSRKFCDMCDWVICRRRIELCDPLDPADDVTLRLSFNILSIYLSSKNLHCDSEKQVVEFLFCWCVRNAKERLNQVGELLEKFVNRMLLSSRDINELFVGLRSNAYPYPELHNIFQELFDTPTYLLRHNYPRRFYNKMNGIVERLRVFFFSGR